MVEISVTKRTCPDCGSLLYGDNYPDAPLMFECGSGYMTNENLPEGWSQSTGCVRIMELKRVIRLGIDYVGDRSAGSGAFWDAAHTALDN